jgi:hypothetical protein
MPSVHNTLQQICADMCMFIVYIWQIILMEQLQAVQERLAAAQQAI